VDHNERISELEARLAELSLVKRRAGWRSRWAAIGAVVAITLGAGTAVRIASAAPGDVVQTSFVPLPPTRILDTRPAPANTGGITGPVGPGATISFQVTGVGGVPANATAVMLNMTADGTTAGSFLTVFPAGTPLPTASNLNWSAGATIPNLVTVKLGTGGKVNVYNFTGTTHVIADVAGYYVPGNDKFIDIDTLGHATDTAVSSDGFGPISGLGFPESARTKASFHVVLPPDYTAGTTLSVSFTWHTGGTSCGVAWRANYVSLSRAGQLHANGPGASDGISGLSTASAGATINLVNTTSFSLVSPKPGFTLQPGDSYTFGIFRDILSGEDTCTVDALIDSMVVRYE
jgi:hypothetical protein